MKNYIPNLVARTIMLAFIGRYKETLALSHQLKTIGSAEVNNDFIFCGSRV